MTSSITTEVGENLGMLPGNPQGWSHCQPAWPLETDSADPESAQIPAAHFCVGL